jgi:hypothetical protein
VSAPAGIATTGADGIASCIWSINSTVANPEVTAELLDPADHRVGLPVIFHARLNTAKLVSYDPKNCEGMSSATPAVVTVQDALDFLCHEKSGVDCCVTIGKLDDRPGDYETIAKALEDLLGKRKETAICLTLLPGDHEVALKDPIQPADEKNPFYFKIDGCSHASRLILRDALVFKNVAAVVIRDISINADEGQLDFDGCKEIEISHCDISGHTSGTSALVLVKGTRELELVGNQIAVAGEAKKSSPETVLEGIGGLAKAYKMSDEKDFERAAEVAAEEVIKLPVAERTKMVKALSAAMKESSADMSAEEKKSYTAMSRTLGTEKPTAKTLAKHLIDLRGKASGTESTFGNAVALFDFAAHATFANNRILGVVSIGGRPALNPLTKDELGKLADMMKKGMVEIKPTAGSLHLRDNDLLQVTVSDLFLAVLRALIKSTKGTLTIGSTHLTDNAIAQGDNFFVGRHLSLSNNRFLLEGPLGIGLGRTAAYIGNVAEPGDSLLHSITQANPPADIGNQDLDVAPL